MNKLSSGRHGLLALAAFGIGTFQAPEARAEGFELGGRMGVGLPMGELIEDTDLKDAVAVQVPFMFDVGFRATPALFIGGYLNLGPIVVPEEERDACEALGGECSTFAFAGGVQAQYHVAPRSGADFWFGGGLGFEGLAQSVTVGDTEVSGGFSAFPQLKLQLGVDFGKHRKVGYGPFISFTHSTFSRASLQCEGNCEGGEFDENEKIPSEMQAGHQWLIIGFRGTFVFSRD